MIVFVLGTTKTIIRVPRIQSLGHYAYNRSGLNGSFRTNIIRSTKALMVPFVYAGGLLGVGAEASDGDGGVSRRVPAENRREAGPSPTDLGTTTLQKFAVVPRRARI